MRLGDLHQSLTYNSYLDCFVLTGVTASIDSSGVIGPIGQHYAFSEDLVHWSYPKPFDLPSQYHATYGALIDHNSPSRNFDTTDEHAKFYFTDHKDNTGMAPPNDLDRDVVRVHVRFFKN